MLRKIAVILLIVGVSMPMHANMNDTINAIRDSSDANKKVLSSTQKMKLEQISTESREQHSALIKKLFSEKQALAQQGAKGKTADGAILFVSFSMPKKMIFTLADEAREYDIPVVIKGLVNADFRQTLQKIADIIEEGKKEGYRMNGLSMSPIWFEQFGIEKVPSLVVTKRPGDCLVQTICANQPFDFVSGNIPIKKALTIIAERGHETPDVARAILERVHD